MKIENLTIREKLRLICGKDYWHTEDFGGKLPSVTMSDGPVGVRRTVPKGDGNEETVPAVAYPSVQMLANTWNKELAYQLGESLASDCAEHDVDLLLAPGVNIKRSPVCGRNFEYFSEDPYLAGILAKEYIAGLQENGTGACLKHFVANNLEFDRLHQSSDVDERTLREIYYKPFEIACGAKPVSVMCSYNRVNGVYASENKTGFDALRNDIGFEGAVISDWLAVRDRTSAAKAGLDLEMPFDQENYEKLVADFEAGKITEKEIDACAERVLRLVSRLTEMRRGRTVKLSERERIGIAKKIASEGMILLKNDGILPLTGKENLAVFGHFAKPADWGMLCGGGSSRVLPLDCAFDLPKELQKRTSGSVNYASAFDSDCVNSFKQNIRDAILCASSADVNIICAGTGAKFEYEEDDRKTLRLSAVQERFIVDAASQNVRTVVVLFAGGVIDVSPWADQVAAILYAGFPGMGSDGIIADILTGKMNPCGKTSETFALLDEYPASNQNTTCGVTRYGEGLDVGYRYFETYRKPVLYPFGYGLSYSEFLYRNLQVKTDGKSVEVSFEIENRSERDGKEISQVYVHECAPLVYRPFMELKGFSKDEVKANKIKTVKMKLDMSVFAHWSIANKQWKITDGVYEILIGASGADIRLRTRVQIKNKAIVLF